MNRRGLGVLLLALGLASSAGIGIDVAHGQEPRDLAGLRFATVDVYVDSAEPLAAWQFELTETSGTMVVVGVENGDSRAFPDAPHYDRDAVASDRADRIIVADYSLAARGELPSGRTRVATVQVGLSGSAAPDFAVQLIAAGNSEGRPIPATATFVLNDRRAP